MLRPQRDIKFVETVDGIGIAYWDIGSGPPIVVIHSWTISHAELEWSVPSIAEFFVALADRYRVIKLDPRGHGLSDRSVFQRGVSDSGAQLGLSTEDAGLDIAAVAEACGVGDFVLMAIGSQGPAAIEFAVRNPEAVRGLILCDTVARIDSSYIGVALRTLAAMSELEADSGVQVAVSMFDRTAPGDELVHWAALERANRPVGRRLTSTILAMAGWDATPLLGRVRVPTLILSSRNPAIDFMAEAQKLAAGIPNSQMRVVDGTFAPYVADRSVILTALAEFLGEEHEGLPQRSQSSSGFRTVVFTDVVGSTEFMEQVGDEEGHSAIRRIEELVIDTARAHEGTVIKHLGDGSLISFSSNANAISFAVALQLKIEVTSLHIRIGMAAGEPIQESGDIYGAVVSQASRIADIGKAGEIIVADSVRQLALGKGHTFEPVGEVSLKGFKLPTTVWKVVT